jgi:radical SAM/Cys-rich protein
MNNVNSFFKNTGLKDFDTALKESQLFPLTANGIEILQINFGKRCNQSCKHCHVEAGPKRTEMIKRETLETCLNILKVSNISTVDITGGSPELNIHFKWFVEELIKLKKYVIVRCNLTIIFEPEQHDLLEFYSKHQVEIIASLPYYSKRNVDAQRGTGVFNKSIEAIRSFNRIGYGQDNSNKKLNLVYNPCGSFLPPTQSSIEIDFKRELYNHYGVRFSHLYTITNMPIGRFLKYLKNSGNYKSYIIKLINAYNSQAVPGVMCRYTLSVGWNGSLYDCDFNQMLGLNCNHDAPSHINDFNKGKLQTRRIVTGLHCYGCTAGAGSSCGGALVK